MFLKIFFCWMIQELLNLLTNSLHFVLLILNLFMFLVNVVVLILLDGNRYPHHYLFFFFLKYTPHGSNPSLF